MTVPATAEDPRLITLSAADPAALDAAARLLGEALADQPGMPVAEVASSLARRPPGPHRLALVASSTTEAAEILLGEPDARTSRGIANTRPDSVVFLFPGVGDHWPGMVAGLYRAAPVFRDALDNCAALAGEDLLAMMVEPAGSDPVEAGRPALLAPPPRPHWLDEPRTAQLAVFAVEYALARLLRDVGIEPAALLGYSIGEYVAAAVADVLPLAQLVPLVTRRAALIETTRPGAMLVVLLGAADVTRYLDVLDEPDLVVGAVDGPGLCVVSGPAAAVDKLASLLADDIVATRRLPSRHAFHSPLLAGIEEPLRRVVDGYRPRPPAIPMLSNLSGGWLTPAEATSGEYWARHMSNTVRFADNLEAMWRLPARVVLEVGPGRMLSPLALAQPGRPPGAPVLAVLPTPTRPGSDVPALLTAIGRAWTAGVPVDLDRATFR